MEQKKIDRINELGRLSRSRGLTDEEKAEQAALREEYLTDFRAKLWGGNPPPKKNRDKDDSLTKKD
jgi:uncharacterized protein YnzC (UPF0291/DUF896 family)